MRRQLTRPNTGWISTIVAPGGSALVARVSMSFISAGVAMMLMIAGALADDGYQTADGLAVYLGIVPAAVVRGHPSNHPEGAMHGGAGSDRHQQHLVVAVFDVATGKRVENARVSATIAGLGDVGRQSLEFEPMTIADTVTYGAFATLPGNDRYEIEVDISVPGRARNVSVTFSSEHVQ